MMAVDVVWAAIGGLVYLLLGPSFVWKDLEDFYFYFYSGSSYSIFSSFGLAHCCLLVGTLSLLKRKMLSHNFLLLVVGTGLLVYTFVIEREGTEVRSSDEGGLEKRSTAETGKRGLIYSNETLTTFFEDGGSITWGYNYESFSNGLEGYEFVPMLANANSESLESWDSNVTAAIEAGSTHALSFNLPDTSTDYGGSDIDSQRAANLYEQYMQPYAGKVKLGSPATSQDDSSSAWLSEFLAACDGCTIDFITVQYFFRTTNTTSGLTDLKRWVNHMHTTFGLPIWIVEFGMTATATQLEMSAMLEATIPWLKTQDFIQRYAWSRCDVNYLTTDSELTLSGQTYQYFDATNATTTQTSTTELASKATVSLTTELVSRSPSVKSTSNVAASSSANAAVRLTGFGHPFFSRVMNFKRGKSRPKSRRGVSTSTADSSSCNVALQSWSAANHAVVTQTITALTSRTTYIVPMNITPFTTLCDG